MGAKNTQFNTRGPFLGEYVSGKYVGYHAEQFTDASPATIEHSATGGIISDYTDPSPGKVYRTHIFTSSGTFDVTSVGSPGVVEYLVVAGGGGGAGLSGYNGGGGGGAGGLRTNLTGNPLAGSAFPVDVQSYTVTVGGGGGFGINAPATKGSDSVFGSITSAAVS